MSPEQLSGDHELDGRCDLYSLGCVLYEMLAGEPPVSASPVQRLLSRKSTGGASAGEVRPEVPPEVDRAVTRALATEPADRFATAGALIEALGPGAAVEGGRGGTRPWLPWAAVVVLVGAAYGIRSRLGSADVSAPSFDGRPSVARSIAVLPFDNLSPDPDSVVWFVLGIREEVSKRLHLGGLTVRSPETVARVYGAGDRSLSEIANELRVDALLAGSVQVIGDRFRFSPRLICRLRVRRSR